MAAATMKVFGSVISPSTMRVLACLYEMDADFEFVPVDMHSKDHKKEHFLSLNPFGQVPAFEDGDLNLFESRAITKYLAYGYADKGTQLIPTGKKGMAEATLWMEVEAQQYDPPAYKLLLEMGYKPMIGMTPDPAVVEENEAKLGKVLDVYESRLGQSKYLAGETFTLADLHHLPTLSLLMGTPGARKLIESRPNIAAWASDILARPAWTKVEAMKNNNQ